MAKSHNEFTPALMTLLKTATDLDHLVTFVPWLHKMAAPTIRKSEETLQRKGAPPNMFGPMTASSVANILHDGEWITRAPVDKRISTGPDVDKMAEEVVGRMNASMLVILHETWEVFVKTAYGKLLFRLKDDARPPDRQGFHQAMPRWRDYRNTPAYFRDYAEWSCRANASKALRFFVAQLSWEDIQITGWGDLEWVDLMSTLAFCRHCIVHNEGRVSEGKWKRLSRPKTKLITSLMRKTILDDQSRILPQREQLDGLIQATMSFAYGLYVLLSQRCGIGLEYKLFKHAASGGSGARKRVLTQEG
jgi:hypothetical protein